MPGKPRTHGGWRLGLALALALGSSTGLAALRSSLANYRAQSYNAAAGLDTESMLHVTRLADGRILLVGVRGEPQLFDGHRFTPLPYRGGERWPGSGAAATAQTSDGAIWVAGAGGLWRFADGRARAISLPAEAAPFQISVSRDGASLVLPTRAGLYEVAVRAPHGARRLGPAAVSTTAAVQDRAGTWWIGSSDGLYTLDVSGALVPVADPRLAHVHIWAMHLDRFGRVLVATRGQGLAIFAPGQPARLLRREDGMPHNVVRAITETPDALWLATAGGGIARWDEQQISVFDSGDGLSSDSVTWLTADVGGVLWATTAGAGLNRLWPSPFTNLADARGRRGGFHYAIHRSPDGRLWAGSNLGLAEIVDGQLVLVGEPGPGQSSTVLGLLDAPAGGLFVASRRGVFHYAAASGFRTVPGAGELLHPALWRSPRFGLLVGARNVLYQLHADRPPEPLATIGPANAVINTFADDPILGLLLATSDGAWSWDGREARPLGPRGRAAGGFWRDGARLYVSGNGLAVLDGDQWQILLPPTGRGTRTAWYNFVADRVGGLWLAGRDGLLRFDRQQLRQGRDPATLPDSVLFTSRDGLPSTEFEGSPQGVLDDGQGRFWLASTGGVTLLDPELPGASASDLELSVQSVENEDRRFPASPGLVLPPGTRRVALAIAALPASHAAAVQLRYRLRPLESGYRSDRGLREAVYGGLPPGEYVLELEGELPGLVPRRGQARYAFRIAPRFLERTSARIGLALAGLLLLAALPILHIRALRRQRRRLVAQVAEQTAALELQARTDGLTGLLNRRAFDEALKSALAINAARTGLIVLDVDHFKRFNDQLGHQAGDHCLQTVARALTRAAAGQARVARIGGEEFALLADGADAAVSSAALQQSLEQLAQTVRVEIAAADLMHPASPAGRITVSLGVALAVPGETPDTLLRRADEALYAAKRGGRDRVVLAWR